MIINGDWTLGEYAKLFGDKLNVCPIPQIVGLRLAQAVRGRHVLHGLRGTRR